MQELEMNAFTRWAKCIMQYRNLTFSDFSDFEDGLKLIQILEVAFNKKCTMDYDLLPYDRILSMMKNCNVAIDFMKELGINIGNITGADIKSKNKKKLLDMIWAIFVKYEGIDKDGFVPKLLKWCQINTNDYKKDFVFPEEGIKDFSSSWVNGLPICALLHKFRSNFIDYDHLNKENPTECLNIVIDAFQKMFIPIVISPEAVINGNERVIILQIIEFYRYIKSNIAVGIDLGGDFCRFGIFRNNTMNSESYRNIIPSSLSIINNEIVVSKDNNSNTDNNDENIINIKSLIRLVGMKYNDPSILSTIKHIPFEVKEHPETHRPVIEIPLNNNNSGTKGSENIRSITAEDMLVMIFDNIKDIVQKQALCEVKYAVISVPNFYSNQQRKSVKESAEKSGLEVLRILNQPLSAAIAIQISQNYKKISNNNSITNENMNENIENNDDNSNNNESTNDGNDSIDNEKKKGKNVLILDLGASKTDISIVQIDENGTASELRSKGSTTLGGMDIDFNIFDVCSEDLKAKTGVDISKNPKAHQKLMSSIESAKIALSSNRYPIQNSVHVNVHEIVPNVDYDREITRSDYKEYVSPIVDRLRSLINNTYSGCNVTPNQTDEIHRFGGSSQIPEIKKMLIHEVFHANKDVLIVDHNPNDGTIEGAIAVSAMKQGMTSKELREIKYPVAITHASYSSESASSVCATIIEKGSSLPAVGDIYTTTSFDFQTNALFKVFMGERLISRNNIYLGEFVMEGIQKVRHGIPILHLTMKINDDGIIECSAVDEVTKSTVSATFEDKTEFSDEEKKLLAESNNIDPVEEKKEADWLDATCSFKMMLKRAKYTAEGSVTAKFLGEKRTKEFLEEIARYKKWLENNQNELPDVYYTKINEVVKILSQKYVEIS